MKTSFNDKIKQNYDHIADAWFEKRDWHIERPSLDEAIRYLAPGATILDLGCGSGKPIAAYLIEQGFDVYGVDFSTKLIDYAAQIIPQEKLFVADLCDFKPTMQFDALICWFVLFHVHASQHLDVLKKFNSFLKPEGLLLMTFADTSCQPEGSDIKIIDDYTIESDMFGARFCHSGHPAKINTDLVKQAGFHIMVDKMDQPGNQVILARKGPEKIDIL